MDFAHALGLNKAPETPEEEREKLQLYINLKLASSGQPTCVPEESARFFGIFPRPAERATARRTACFPITSARSTSASRIF